MFKNFGKKKQADEAPEEFSAQSPQPSATFMPGSGQSLFAGQLNPQPANIDFFSAGPLYGPAWEPPPIPPPLPGEMPAGMPDSFPPPGLPMEPMGYAEPTGPPELAPYGGLPPLPPAEQLPWEPTVLDPEPMQETPAWEQPLAEAPAWEQPAADTPPAWQQPTSPGIEPPVWEQPAASEAAPWEQAPAGTEAAPWQQAIPDTPVWEQPDIPAWEAPPTPSSETFPGAEPFSWEAPSTEEPLQVSQIYPEDAFAPPEEPAWTPPPAADLPPSVADLYPPDLPVGPTAETVPMPDLQPPPPEVHDPHATRFEETDPFHMPVADLMQGFEASAVPASTDFYTAEPAGIDAIEMAPAPDLSAHLYTGAAEPAEDPFAVDTSVDPFAPEAVTDPFAVEPVGNDLFSPGLPGGLETSDLSGFGLDSAPVLAESGDFNFEPPDVADVQSGTPALDLWDNLDTGTPQAGSQFPDAPEAPGQFLDSVNAQLYPDDPFSIDSGSLGDSAQAFEEASHLLFPETASAPVEWEEADPIDPLATAPLPPPEPMELGPSYQMETGVFSDLTDSYQPPAEPTSYEAMPSMAGPPPVHLDPAAETPESISGFADDTDAEITWTLDPATMPATDGSNLWAGEAAAAEIHPHAAPEPAPANEFMHPYAEPAEPVGIHPYAEAFPATVDPGGIHPYAEPAGMHPYAEEAAYTHPYAEEPALAPSDLSDYGAFSPTEPLSNPDLADAFGEEAEELVPTYTLDNVIPMPQPQAEQTAPAMLPAPAEPYASPAMAMENLQILGFCQLEEGKRLLMVESDGTFALMGQAGDAHNPTITKIKEFSYNPLQYQNTFTAVKEAAAEDQGMYITQVGTWRAIISTVKNTILLHTELG